MTEPEDREFTLDTLMPDVFAELREIAERSMRHERADHTLQPSALVNEVYLRLEKQRGQNWQNRAHFFAAASEAIRRILIEHARRYNAAKRNDGRRRVALEEEAGGSATTVVTADLLDLDDALSDLGQQDRRLETVVQLRYFGGLTMQEIAGVLGLSKRTVETDWSMARAWLRREMGTDASGQSDAGQSDAGHGDAGHGEACHGDA